MEGHHGDPHHHSDMLDVAGPEEDVHFHSHDEEFHKSTFLFALVCSIILLKQMTL